MIIRELCSLWCFEKMYIRTLKNSIVLFKYSCFGEGDGGVKGGSEFGSSSTIRISLL